MQRKTTLDMNREAAYDPTSIPFKEFRDSEIGTDWGLGPEAIVFQRSHSIRHATKSVLQLEALWQDDQVQPLPRSARRYFDGWVRAEELAKRRWDAEVVVCAEPSSSEPDSKMRTREVQLTHSQVLTRSSFCRKVLATCYLLERVDHFVVEHQWENFTCAVGPDGWQAKLHILSPGMKPGGGVQHKPILSKTGLASTVVVLYLSKSEGCYMVRLYFVGAWRCVWVNDLVPTDANEAPLLPFSPPPSIITSTPAKGAKAPPTVVTPVVQLWPLLLCKALAKLAAFNMSDENGFDDEPLKHLDILHCLTGATSIQVFCNNSGELWKFLQKEVTVFSWDDEDDDSMKTKSTKKPTTKDFNRTVATRNSIVTFNMKDTLGVPSYEVAGLTPAHDQPLLITVARDLPLIKPPSEPEVPLWKTYRWVEWARAHGLYDDYICPRKKWLKAMGLLKISYSPHLLDVKSTESIANVIAREEKYAKRISQMQSSKTTLGPFMPGQPPELMDWMDFERLFPYVKWVTAVYLPSMVEAYAAGSSPSVRIPTAKGQLTRPSEIRAPCDAPLYLQVDSEREMTIRLSLSTLHPRILFNSGNALGDFIKPAYLFLEQFEWLSQSEEPPTASGYLETRGYDALSVVLPPGRHFFRLWTNSFLTWHTWVLSEASLVLCKRNAALVLSILECPWATKAISIIGTTFGLFSKILPNGSNISVARDFYKSYAPDQNWDNEVVGYPRAHLHWMFSRAVEQLLGKNLAPADYNMVCRTLGRLLLDPDFGLPKRPPLVKPIRNLIESVICDCRPEEEIPEDSERMVSRVDSGALQGLLQAVGVTDSFELCESTGGIHCEDLRAMIEELVAKHEAAVLLQSHWKRVRCQRMMRNSSTISQEAVKIISEQVFGSSNSLSALMNKLFNMFPGVRSAYSYSSALGGRYSMKQHTGVSVMTFKDNWIPLFNGIFYCHSPVQVHFDLNCSLRKTSMIIYNNDTGSEILKAMNSHMTYTFSPNMTGYTTHGHAWEIFDENSQGEDIPWELTVLCSVEGVFHVCDNIMPNCQELPLAEAYKLHLEEMFIPNRKNILGTAQLCVVKPTSVSVRVSTTWPELEMTAILRIASPKPVEVSRCTGRGELYWPHIALEPPPSTFSFSNFTAHHQFEKVELGTSSTSTRKPLPKKPGSARKATSARTKRPFTPPAPDPRFYDIEIIASDGWPLTTNQWVRVDTARNHVAVEAVRPVSARKLKHVGIDDMPFITNPPKPGDASFELEVSLPVNGGATAKRNDERDLAWAAEQRSWEERGKNRQMKGSIIRDEFRMDHLVPEPEAETESESVVSELIIEGIPEDEHIQSASTDKLKSRQKLMESRPSLASNASYKETMSTETIEEERYLTKPAHLLDEFIPLYFVPLCTKEETETIVLTPEAAKAAKADRLARIEAAIARSEDLQQYNIEHVLGRQKRRNQLIEKLFVDNNWRPKLAEALEVRDEAAFESNARNISLRSMKNNKKK